MASPNPQLVIFALTALFLAVSVSAECTCDTEDVQKDPKSVTIRYKVAALFLILVPSGLGVAAPLAGKFANALRPDNDLFFVVKAFSAGVILATGLIHILPDSFEQLSSPCLEGAWNDFPFAGFVAMVAAIATLMTESTATGYYRRVHFREGETVVTRD